MAVKRGVKKREGENLSDANVEKVIARLEAEKPITKKEACEMLSIAYNTTRLGKIIAEFKDKQEMEKKRRAANRGKPASDFERRITIEEYLAGESLKTIADQLYRSVDFVKKIIEEVGVPQQLPGENYTNFSPLPEQCIQDSFNLGELVWSSKYGAIAEVDRDVGEASDGTRSRVYRIFVHQQMDPDKMLIDGKRYSVQPQSGGGFYAYQRAYDLGSLAHLLAHGVDLKRAIK